MNAYSTAIPKKLHLIWIGDRYRRPDDCIVSWRDNHPGWQFKLWTDQDLLKTTWLTEPQIDAFRHARQWSAIADLMRYEILYREGGVYVDADSYSLRPLDDWLL